LSPSFTHRRYVFLAWLALASAVVLNGCAGHNPHPVGSYERGVYYAEKGKDLEAVAALESYVRYNPTDSLAAEAQFLKAKTYMHMNEYPLAAVEFQILRKDYPTSPRVEEALFREGECYLEKVGRIERDISGAREARMHFLRFAQDYPSSEFMPEVRAYMQDISDIMVLKRLQQVKVYRQLGRHKAVGMVLDDILQDEQTSTLIPEVMWERAQTARKLDDPDTEATMYERLISTYPDSGYVKEARKRLTALDQEEAALDDLDSD
jgi:outer membrane assembly lipoprotein YfiO